MRDNKSIEYLRLKLRSILLTALSILLCSFPLRAEEDLFVLVGNVRDKATSAKLVGANVKIFDDRDSIVAETTAESWEYSSVLEDIVKGNSFEARVPRNKTVYTIKISYEEFDTLVSKVDLTDMGRREKRRDLGTFYLQRPKVNQLNEVTVTASKVKFYNRGDTIVYNADAFQLADGSMLDALIKQLPGVDLRDGGQIYVNGQYVEELLLNGRDFFKGDNQVMLDNLGAYMVKNVEVYKKASDKDKFMGIDDPNQKKLVMDVKIKKEYVGGWNFNLEAGAGTKDRYLGRFFGMHFTALSQYTLYGNVNNLNDSRSPTSDNEWNPAYRPEGTKIFREGGFNYSTESSDGNKKAEGSVVLRSMRTTYDDQQSVTNFLPTANTYEYSATGRRVHDFYLNTHHTITLQKENKYQLEVNPFYEFRYGKTWSLTESGMFDSEMPVDTAMAKVRQFLAGKYVTNRQNMINASYNNAYNGDYHMNIGAEAYFGYDIPKTPDYLMIQVSYKNKNHHTTDNAAYLIGYGDKSLSPVARTQHQSIRPNHANEISGYLGYSTVIMPKLRLTLDYDFYFQRQTKNSAFYMGQLQSEASGDYTIGNLEQIVQEFDPTNSFYSVEDRMEHNLKMQLNYRSKKLFLLMTLPIGYTNNSLTYNQAGTISSPKINYISPNGTRVVFQYDFNRDQENGKFDLLQLNYRLNVNSPKLIDMVEIENTTNPLNIYLGNPDLNEYYTHTLSGYLSIQRKKITNYLSFALNLNKDAISKGYMMDMVTGTRYYKSYNVHGNRSWSINYGGTWEFLKRFSLDYESAYTVNRMHTMVGKNTPELTPMRMDNRQLDIACKLKYEPISKLRFELGYAPKWQWTRSQLESSLNVRDDKYSFKVTAKLPYHWSIRTSVDLFSRNGYGDPQLDTNDWIWNARVSKSFDHGKWVLALDAYDLLHQMKNITYTISPQCRIEKFTNTIPRYILLHAQYKINIMPKRKEVKPQELYKWDD